MNYIFTSQRLGFRNWLDSDLPKLAAINADEGVIKFFSSTQTKARTKSLSTECKFNLKRTGSVILQLS